MDRSEYQLKKKLEKSLWDKPMVLEENETPPGPAKKAVVRMLLIFAVFPIVGVIAYLLWSAIRIVLGSSGYAGIN